MKKIFVYGTLKSGNTRNIYITRDGGKFLGKASTVPKYLLVRQWFDSFPSMIEYENGVSVEGELWLIADETLKILDSVEGVHKGLFKRVTVKLLDGGEAEAYVAVEKPFFSWKLGNSWKST